MAGAANPEAGRSWPGIYLNGTENRQDINIFIAMKKSALKHLPVFLFLFISFTGKSQSIDKIISQAETERIVSVLASDDMRGRKVYTPDIDRAAAFIESEFKAAGLKTWKGAADYKQDFSIVSPKQVSMDVTENGQAANATAWVVVTCIPKVHFTDATGFEKADIKAGQNLFQEAQKLVRSGKNYFVNVDTSFTKNFSRLSNLKRQMFSSTGSVVFRLGDGFPAKFTVDAVHDIVSMRLRNVLGILPGKSKKEEYVVFSGHYDHLGIGKVNGTDSIFNGANDDAAGTTAVILLAKYFAALHNNERTLVFVAFTAEESGGYGSQYFSRQMDADKVMAMFNIEMIGTESKWGKDAAYITGYEKTNMGEILQSNLEGSGFTFHPDPYPQQNLFYRSDNATLARLGVPAHTISTSKMDSEPNYHKMSDEVSTLDTENMARIIRSVAISAKTIISGQATPTRVNAAELR